MRPDTRSPVCAHRASPPPCRRFGTVLLATKRHPASAASAFTRMQPDTRPPVRTHRAPPPLCRRFGAPSPRGGLPPPKGSGSILPPAPDGRRCKAPFRATSSPGRPRTLGRSARPTRRKRPAFPGRRPDAADPKYAPYYTRLVGNVPAPTSPAPLRANPDRTRAVAGIHPRTSAVPDVSAAVGPSFAAGSAPTFGATGGSVSSMRNSPSRSFCQSRIYP